ncbi:MAG: rhodanese-like domain-containing protein [Saprospiraceae bacterium]|nr:rhodanese-like domain-containing protein [Saprospiraceae bacterium]MBK7811701.1 rhodanese-like domain-containing protein [Saprospiraceae bacterium]MBK9631578.1 rhodanese-like domain-containing protein [Saprospiraceae bacterium]
MGFFSSLFGMGNDSVNLAELIKKGAFLVDVRTSGEFAGGSVKGAVNIPLDAIASNLKKFKGKENVIVFCRSGARSGQAKTLLNQNGIQNVYNGGAWDEVARLVN